MMFCNVYKIESLAAIRWNSIITALIAVAVIFTAGLVFVLLFVAGLVFVLVLIPDRTQKGVILQAIFRSNFAIIGIPLATNIFGEEGQAAAALMSAFSVPMFNVLAVVSLVLFTRKKTDSAVTIRWRPPSWTRTPSSGNCCRFRRCGTIIRSTS